MNFANVGIPVTIIEQSQERLDKGLSIIRKNYENTAAKGRITSEQVEERMKLIDGQTSLDSLNTQDLIIEAWSRVFGDRKDVELCLNSFGKDTSFLKSYGQRFDVNILWKTTHKMLNSEACAIIMFSKFLNLYEFEKI